MTELTKCESIKTYMYFTFYTIFGAFIDILIN